MKPINDNLATVDTKNVQKVLTHDNSTDLLKLSAENFEKINPKLDESDEITKLICSQKPKDEIKMNICETENRKILTNVPKDNGQIINVDASLTETNINETKVSSEQETFALREDEALKSLKENNKNSGIDAKEVIEYHQNVEDVEIPEEEEVDEIIVPDEAEAEDLTDGKSLEEDVLQNEEESNSKGSLIEDNVTSACLPEEEEDTSKSCELVEKEFIDDSDRKSSSNDVVPEENSSKASSDNEDVIQNSPSEAELIEDEIKSNELTTKSNVLPGDEDTNCETTAYDPLNCVEHKESNAANENSSTDQLLLASDTNEIKNVDEEDNDDEDDDDEVQFIETRNSPICIESDEEDEVKLKASKTTETPQSDAVKCIASKTFTLPRSIIMTRTSARKSTAKPQQNPLPAKKIPPLAASPQPQIQNKTNNSRSLAKTAQIDQLGATHQIVDCIELLDSSDEESTPPRHRSAQVKQTPQKRTLLAAKGNYYKNNNNKVANASAANSSSRLPNNFPPHVKQQPKKPLPPPLPPPTPQSNFLNAVQLQPAVVSGANPPAFSALLSNKKVIIPNAFYGNPPSITVSPEIDLERRYTRWLETFINQFCKPQFVATHSCLVFLQRALKYKDFVRIKALRASMNSHAHTQGNANHINGPLFSDIRTILLKNNKKLSYFGRRLCELTCSATPGKSVALMAHAVSGKVTLKTCNMELPKSTNSPASSTSSSAYTANNSLTRKRQPDEDEDDEYTPDKPKVKKAKPPPPVENGEVDRGEMGDERKRSLRTKRTRRLDNSFSYNEDDLLAEYEIDDEDDQKLIQMEVQRKIEQKRLEAQKQRQQQVKSFESAFIQAFAKSIDRPTTSAKPTKNDAMQRIRLNNTTTSTVTSMKSSYTTNNDAEELLEATWIETVENDETHVVISDDDDDEPKEHRIYKQPQLQQQSQQPQKTSNSKALTSARANRRSQEIITGDDDYEENNCTGNIATSVEPLYWPKNIDSQMCVNGKHSDRCVICNLSCQRLVHHYVNEHRGCEIYNSRLSLSQIKLLKQQHCTVANVSVYKSGQYQYEAFCIFCQKKSRFLLPYWHQHFSMHTGEYAYRCLGCGIRKPTRSLLAQHQAQGCPEEGTSIAQDYAHDPKLLQIEAKICNLCNYIQLHRGNIVKHLHTQHYIKQILPKHIQTIVLMRTPANFSAANTYTPTDHYNHQRSNERALAATGSATTYDSNTYIIDDDDEDEDGDEHEVTIEEITPDATQQHSHTNNQNNYYNYIPPYMQAAVNAGNFSFADADNGEDLSFMICGMLDVQMSPETN